MAAAHEAHRRPTGRPVEGLGDRRPPVDDDGLLLVVGHREAADVEGVAALAGAAVDAAEHERGVAQIEVREALDDVLVDHVPLPAGLLGAAPADLDHRAQALGGVPRPFQALVGLLDVRLLGLEVGVYRHRPPFAARPMSPRASLPRNDPKGIGHAIASWIWTT